MNNLGALPIKTAKEYTAYWNEQPEHIRNYNEKYFKDNYNSKFRIYIPIEMLDERTEKKVWESNTFIDINNMIDYDMDFIEMNRVKNRDYLLTPIGYMNGYIEEQNLTTDKKQNVKLGKFLQKHRPELLKAYNEDPIRAMKNLRTYAVISRHPYDIAGMSTDRNWESCMTLPTKKIHSYKGIKDVIFEENNVAFYPKIILADGTSIASDYTIIKVDWDKDNIRQTLKEKLTDRGLYNFYKYANLDLDYHYYFSNFEDVLIDKIDDLKTETYDYPDGDEFYDIAESYYDDDTIDCEQKLSYWETFHNKDRVIERIVDDLKENDYYRYYVRLYAGEFTLNGIHFKLDVKVKTSTYGDEDGDVEIDEWDVEVNNSNLVNDEYEFNDFDDAETYIKDTIINFINEDILIDGIDEVFSDIEDDGWYESTDDGHIKVDFETARDYCIEKFIDYLDEIDFVQYWHTQKFFLLFAHLFLTSFYPIIIKDYELYDDDFQLYFDDKKSIVLIKNKRYIKSSFASDAFLKPFLSKIKEDIIKEEKAKLGYDTHRAGSNCHYVRKDIVSGSLIAYEVAEDDLNIEQPKGRMLIQPLFNSDKSNWVLEAYTTYGNTSMQFRNVVQDWIEKYNKKTPSGTYELPSNLYSDGRSITKTISGLSGIDHKRSVLMGLLR